MTPTVLASKGEMPDHGLAPMNYQYLRSMGHIVGAINCATATGFDEGLVVSISHSTTIKTVRAFDWGNLVPCRWLFCEKCGWRMDVSSRLQRKVEDTWMIGIQIYKWVLRFNRREWTKACYAIFISWHVLLSNVQLWFKKRDKCPFVLQAVRPHLHPVPR